MRQNRHMRRLFCGVLALMSGFALPGAVEANTGLRADMESIWDGTKYTDYYVGESGRLCIDIF